MFGAAWLRALRNDKGYEGKQFAAQEILLKLSNASPWASSFLLPIADLFFGGANAKDSNHLETVFLPKDNRRVCGIGVSSNSTGRYRAANLALACTAASKTSLLERKSFSKGLQETLTAVGPCNVDAATSSDLADSSLEIRFVCDGILVVQLQKQSPFYGHVCGMLQGAVGSSDNADSLVQHCVGAETEEAFRLCSLGVDRLVR